MKCQKCSWDDTRVLDSRLTDEGTAVRRRRECPKCAARFTTYERPALHPYDYLVVTKKDGRQELFDRNKIEFGIMKSCEKRPVTVEEVRQAVNDIETSMRNPGVREVRSIDIGEAVMEKLRILDDVAYIRFASVYQEFEDAHRFAETLAALNPQRLVEENNKSSVAEPENN